MMRAETPLTPRVNVVSFAGRRAECRWRNDVTRANWVKDVERLGGRQVANVVKPIPVSAAVLATFLALPTARAAERPQAPPPDTSPVPPFAQLLDEPVTLRSDLAGQHPRLFFDRRGLEALRARTAAHPSAWREFLAQARALRDAPPEPPAQGRGEHYAAGLGLPEPAFAFAVTRDPQHLAQARRWLEAVLAYEPWGYTYSKPDQDIPAGHLLYGLAFAYDLLHDDLAPGERRRIVERLRAKGDRLFAAYAPRPGRRYTFSQNHTFINAAALACAAIVLDEPDAGPEPGRTQRWLRFARAAFDRTLRTFSKDGYFYEGYHYFEFSVPWLVHYLDALELNTGEQLYERTRLDLARLYVAHSLLPDGRAVDFGDTGRGAADRLAGRAETLGGHQLLYRVASRMNDPASAAVAEWVSSRLRLPVREPVWRFIWRDPATVPSLDAVPLVHHFEDAGVVFARTGWGREDVAFAFKAGPPEGHAATRLAAELPEWRQNTGHAHPDAGSFIVFARGRYLTGDAGYTGVKLTAHHNALLVDGHGQAHDGRHEVFKDVGADRLAGIRVTGVEASHGRIAIGADLAAAYDASLGVLELTRTFTFDGARAFTIEDHARFAEPRVLSVLVQSDHDIQPEATGGFRLAPGLPTLDLQFDAPDVSASIAPRRVVAQGRPGSVERGEPEVRGTTLRFDLPAARETRARWRLILRDSEALSAPALTDPAPPAVPPARPFPRQELP